MIDLQDILYYLVNSYYPYELKEYGVGDMDGVVEQVIAKGMGWA